MKLTHVLIILFVLVFLLEIYLSSTGYLQSAFDDYGFSLKAIEEGKYWTFITSIFLHGNVEHLVINLIAFFFFGIILEEALGWKKFLLIFFISAVIGNLAVLGASYFGIIRADVPTVGASGAIFGILGAAMLIKPFELVIVFPNILPVPLVVVALLYTISNVASFLILLATGQYSQTAYAAHIGGLLTGLYFGLQQQKSWKGVLVVVALILILIFVPSIWILIEYWQKLNFFDIFRRF